MPQGLSYVRSENSCTIGQDGNTLDASTHVVVMEERATIWDSSLDRNRERASNRLERAAFHEDRGSVGDTSDHFVAPEDKHESDVEEIQGRGQESTVPRPSSQVRESNKVHRESCLNKRVAAERSPADDLTQTPRGRYKYQPSRNTEICSRNYQLLASESKDKHEQVPVSRIRSMNLQTDSASPLTSFPGDVDKKVAEGSLSPVPFDCFTSSEGSHQKRPSVGHGGNDEYGSKEGIRWHSGNLANQTIDITPVSLEGPAPPCASSSTFTLHKGSNYSHTSSDRTSTITSAAFAGDTTNASGERATSNLTAAFCGSCFQTSGGPNRPNMNADSSTGIVGGGRSSGNHGETSTKRGDSETSIGIKAKKVYKRLRHNPRLAERINKNHPKDQNRYNPTGEIATLGLKPTGWGARVGDRYSNHRGEITIDGEDPSTSGESTGIETVGTRRKAEEGRDKGLRGQGDEAVKNDIDEDSVLHCLADQFRSKLGPTIASRVVRREHPQPLPSHNIETERSIGSSTAAVASDDIDPASVQLLRDKVSAIDMEISGTGIALPWRDRTHQVPPHVTSITVGMNRRRLRREQSTKHNTSGGGGTRYGTKVSMGMNALNEEAAGTCATFESPRDITSISTIMGMKGGMAGRINNHQLPNYPSPQKDSRSMSRGTNAVASTGKTDTSESCSPLDTAARRIEITVVGRSEPGGGRKACHQSTGRGQVPRANSTFSKASL